MWPRDVTNISHFFQEEKAEVRFFRSLLPLLPPLWIGEPRLLQTPCGFLKTQEGKNPRRRGRYPQGSTKMTA